LESGYKATTAGNLIQESEKVDRIPRIGADFNSFGWLSRQKFHFKIAQHYHKQPFFALAQVNALRKNLRMNPVQTDV
jgi:hypothetical protein